MYSVGYTKSTCNYKELIKKFLHLNFILIILCLFQVRQITPPPTSCIPFVQKTEMLSQRFNICGTPSSSPVESGNKNSVLRKPMCRATLEPENDLFDDSPNHSDDEAILSECIRAAIPKVSLFIPFSTNSDYIFFYKPLSTNFRLN